MPDSDRHVVSLQFRLFAIFLTNDRLHTTGIMLSWGDRLVRIACAVDEAMPAVLVKFLLLTMGCGSIAMRTGCVPVVHDSTIIDPLCTVGANFQKTCYSGFSFLLSFWENLLLWVQLSPALGWTWSGVL